MLLAHAKKQYQFSICLPTENAMVNDKSFPVMKLQWLQQRMSIYKDLKDEEFQLDEGKGRHKHKKGKYDVFHDTKIIFNLTILIFPDRLSCFAFGSECHFTSSSVLLL